MTTKIMELALQSRAPVDLHEHHHCKTTQETEYEQCPVYMSGELHIKHPPAHVKWNTVKSYNCGQTAI